MNKIEIYLYLSLLLLSSCATKQLIDSDSDKKDLVQTFPLDDERLEKFKTTKVVRKRKKVIKYKKSKKELRKESKAKVINETAVKPELEKASKFKTVDPTLDPKYPELFKKYNKKYEKFWGQYNETFFPGEKFHLKVSWSFFTAGIIVLESLGDLAIDGTEVIGFKAELNSAEYFESVYKLRDTLFSYVTKENFQPVKYVLKQRESGQSVDDLQLFDNEKLKTYFWYNRLKKGTTKKYSKEGYLPRYFTDSFSALYFLRGLPFKIGNVYEIPVVTRTKVWILKAEIGELETIKVMGQNVRAYKVRAETHFPGVLKKKGDILFWYSADSKRKLLKFKAKVKIGTVKGILEKYEEGSAQ